MGIVIQSSTGGWRARALAVAGIVAAALAISLIASAERANAAVAPESTDVMFIFDTSGSMSGELGEAQEKILEVISQTQATLPNVAFGVANVEDIPGYEYGRFEKFDEETDTSSEEELTEQEYEQNPEKAWQLDQPVTTETSKVASAIDGLTIKDGGDGPEAYARALWETDTNPNVGWRAGTRHEIVLIADNVPHNPDLNEGIPAEFQLTEPFTDGEDEWPDTHEEPGGKFGIPGTVWTAGTNLAITAVAKQLATDGKPLQSVEFYGDEDGFLHYWEYWAGLSGGHALNGSNGELAKDLTSIIETGACSGTCEPPPPHATTTQVICNLVIATASDTCTATVGDTASSGAINPTGTVTFASSSGGTFAAGSTCTLVATPLSSNTSSCSVEFLPPTGASTAPAITATYGGDGKHVSSSGSTTYPPADELIGHIDLSLAGTIHPGGTVEVPIECGFPCITSGDLFTGPGLAGLASFSPAQLTASASSASSHGKKKKKKKPLLLGTGTLKLNAAGKGKLIIKLTGKAKRALSHTGKHGVKVTLKVSIETANGTLVGTKTERITLHKAKKHH
jgi:hypothetical protein